MILLDLKNVSKTYDGLQAIADITLSVQKHEIVCILGPSGCGKTTLLNLISGLLIHENGTIKNRAEKIGYVFQEDRLIEWCSVYENIQLVSERVNKEAIYYWIEKVGLKGFEEAYPTQLSGGMRQRCSIARAFYYDAPLLLMDEPFKSLDYTLRLEMVQNVIDLWKKTKNSIVFVTHEIDEAIMLGNKIVVLSQRPSCVVDTITISKPQEERKLSDPQLIEARNQIIHHLLQGE